MYINVASAAALPSLPSRTARRGGLVPLQVTLEVRDGRQVTAWGGMDLWLPSLFQSQNIPNIVYKYTYSIYIYI